MWHRGLIPAHAGSTGLLPRAVALWRAHPRSRGEHRSAPPGGLSVAGSSPLTRGALALADAQRNQRRLIPAHAGSTPVFLWLESVGWAHPRSRGEHNVTSSAIRAAVGSSPLTRGARDLRKQFTDVEGLIPAHAGSTPMSTAYRSIWWAHPRSRGEHVGQHLVACALVGSSPLTRGALPAPPRPAPGPRAHPRSRGEHVRRRPLRNAPTGSSPLTRGAPIVEFVCQRVGGLIPAHAGSTLR